MILKSIIKNKLHTIIQETPIFAQYFIDQQDEFGNVNLVHFIDLTDVQREQFKLDNPKFILGYQFCFPKPMQADNFKLANEFVEFINNQFTNKNIGLKIIRSKVFAMIYIHEQFLVNTYTLYLADIQTVHNSKNILIDYSSPNMAKELHVGHIRSTIIGDSLVRLNQLLGHNVIIQNHVGDFGKPLAMIVAYILYHEIAPETLNLNNIKEIYVEANTLETSNENQEFNDWVIRVLNVIQTQLTSNHKLNESNQILTNYQTVYNQILMIYQTVYNISLQHILSIYQELNVLLNDSNIRGESSYLSLLKQNINDLLMKNIAQKDEDNSIIVTTETFSQLGQNKLPTMVIQRNNGSFLYSTTDLAAINYRINDLNADKILYVVDERQSTHFKSIFAIAKAQNKEKEVELQHVNFGSILGNDNKPLKSRDGSVITLQSLIDEAKTRIHDLLINRYDVNELDKYLNVKLHEKLAIGVLKYADLSKNRVKDFVFDWDNLLSFKGNSSIYLQYTAVRINSILNQKCEVQDFALNEEHQILLNKLIFKQFQFNEVLQQCYSENKMNYLCDYLQELCRLFNHIYNEIKFIDNGVMNSLIHQLLMNCQFILNKGLFVLGIEVPNEM